MKALISPNESFTWTWISSWEVEGVKFTPVYSQLAGCHRVAQVEPDNKVFDVSLPLYWVDCPDNCVVDEWYFKDGQFFEKPKDVETPVVLTNVEILP